MKIKAPVVVWRLGDPEQFTTQSNVTILTRPLFYHPKGSDRPVRVGDINPDYAEPLMHVLLRVKR